jgi:hypothetical protein
MSSSATERSVDSLQRIYAVIVALAVGQAIRLLFSAPADADIFIVAFWEHEAVWPFVSFIFTVVPFYHGMNRHLDRCYIERHATNVQGMLLFDFVVFFIEASLLFIFASSLHSGLVAFGSLAILLGVDTIWALVSHFVHYKTFTPSVRRWAVLNSVAIALGGVVVFLEVIRPEGVLIVLALIAVVRSVLDYHGSWEFYFPPAASAEGEPTP